MEEQSRHGHADTAGSSTKSLGRPGAGVLALAAMELLAKAPVLGCAGKMQRQRQRGSALGRWICRAVAPPRVRLRDGRHLAYAESGASKEDARFKVVFSHGFTGSRLDTVRPAPVSVPPRPLDLALHGKDSSFCGSACVLPPQFLYTSTASAIVHCVVRRCHSCDRADAIGSLSHSRSVS